MDLLKFSEQISTVNITGLNWLQHGDLLNLQVKYTGSPPFDYCALYKEGQYNITGNETCIYKTRTVSNAFPLVHYFSDSDQHTVVVVVENDVGKIVSRATINIYKGMLAFYVHEYHMDKRPKTEQKSVVQWELNSRPATSAPS